MSVTAFYAITTALIAVLQTNPPVSPNIYRARDRQVPEQDDSAIVVQYEGGTPTLGAIRGAPVDWLSKFTVECFARSSSDTADLAVDPLLLGVYGRIAADTTLGGLVDDIGAPMIEAEYSTEGKKTGWVRMTYAISHRTQNLTLS